ncbi:MAG TPA: zinc ribbon domain-containing protein, partial [Candidatus Polarisedimenticolia bacterium]|nr:zinc ribbon domain-containing protein [Candidatus Polarisedimenticolia bacterium]
MPLFDFLCDSCGHRFEELVSEGEVPPCPECGGAKAERLLPVFAVGSRERGAAPAPGACGTCGD